MKKLIASLLATTMVLTAVGGLVACGGDEDNGKTIKIWAPANSINAYKALVPGFKEANPDYKDWTFKFENKEESLVQAGLADPKAGANIFFFPSDHLCNLAFKLKCLQPLTPEYETLVKARDGADSVDFVTKTEGGKESLYAFPATDDNGYFLWYDSTLLDESDLETWDSLVDAAKREKKTILYNYKNTYYAASFFFGTGTEFDYVDNQLKEYRTNVDGPEGQLGGAAYMRYFTPSYMGTGKDQVILASDPDSALAEAFNNKTIVAGVGGTWVKQSVMNALGDDYSRIKTAVLPKFTTNGEDEYYMESFIGNKYCGVNSTKSEEQIVVSLAFANYLTGEVGQQARYNATGAGPTNTTVKATETVQNDPILATYRAQKEHGYPQRDQGTAFWEGINKFVEQISLGTTTQTNLKAQLDKLASSLRG